MNKKVLIIITIVCAVFLIATFLIPGMKQRIFEVFGYGAEEEKTLNRFDGYIPVIYAEHLDNKRHFVMDVTEYVNKDDGVYYNIPDTHYIRVVFQKKLTKNDRIDVVVNGTFPSSIYVYEKNGKDIVGLSENVTLGVYFIYLNHTKADDTFDLKSVGDVNYDFIADPPAPPTWTTLTDIPDPVNVPNNITYTGVGNDPDDDQYKLFICSSSTAMAGGGPTPNYCADTHYCNSSFVDDLAEATCNYTTTTSDAGNFSQWGFLCDDTYRCTAGKSVSTEVNIPADNTPPTFTDLSNSSIYTNQSLMVDFDATDETAFDCFSVNDTTNFAINCTGGLVNVTTLSIKQHWLNITINDTSNNTNSSYVYVNVSDWNLESPYFITLSNVSIYTNQNVNEDFDANDPDGNFDTWQVNDTTNFEIDDNGVLTNITDLSIKQYWLNITINDTTNNLNSTEIYVNVTLAPDVTPPTFTDIANLTTYNNQSIGVNFNATDETAFDCFSVNDTTNFNVNCSGYFENVTTLTIQQYWINITINDTSNNTASREIYINVSDWNLEAPYFTDIVNSTIYSNQSIEIDLNATDSDGNFDTWAINDTNNFQIDDNGLFENITTLSVQTYWIEITINDTSNEVNSTTIYVTVNDYDIYSPYFTDIENLTIYTNQSVGIDLNATDDEGNFDCWSVNDTTNFAINCSGYLENVTALTAGRYWLEITINDSLNNLNTTTMFVNVSTEAVLDTEAPYFTDLSNISIYTNQSVGQDFDAEDETGFSNWTVNYTEFSINSTGWINNVTNLTVQLYWVNITINDTSNNLNSTVIFINVSEVAADTTPPTFTYIANQTIYNDDNLGVDFNASDDYGISSWTINYSSPFSINNSGYLENITNLTIQIYYINVTVNDTSNNQNSTVIFVNVLTPTAPSTTGDYFPMIYFLLLVVWLMLVVVYYGFEDWSLTMLVSFAIIILGFQVINVGLDGNRTWISTALGLVYFGAGVYILIRTGIDTIQKYL